MTNDPKAPVSTQAVCLPALASLAVVVVMAVAAQLVGFLHPQVVLGAGQFDGVAPTTNAALAADLSGRLHWSLVHAGWWVLQVATVLALVRLLWIDCAPCGTAGLWMRRFLTVSAPMMWLAMLAAGWLGVRFPGPLAAALQALPQAPAGAVVAGGAVWVNAGSATVIFMLAVGFSTLVLRAQWTGDGAASERFDQLLWLGAVFLALTTLEVCLGYRWAVLLLSSRPGEELAVAVACAQTRVIGGVASLSLAVVALSALGGTWEVTRAASVAHWSARALAVCLPALVALAAALCR